MSEAIMADAAAAADKENTERSGGPVPGSSPGTPSSTASPSVPPMVHHPLPRAFTGTSAVHAAKARRAEFDVEKKKVANTNRVVVDRRAKQKEDSLDRHVMLALSDVVSNSVVCLGRDRLRDDIAEKKVKEYRDYEEKKGKKAKEKNKSKK